MPKKTTFKLNSFSTPFTAEKLKLIKQKIVEQTDEFFDQNVHTKKSKKSKKRNKKNIKSKMSEMTQKNEQFSSHVESHERGLTPEVKVGNPCHDKNMSEVRSKNGKINHINGQTFLTENINSPKKDNYISVNSGRPENNGNHNMEINRPTPVSLRERTPSTEIDTPPRSPSPMYWFPIVEESVFTPDTSDLDSNKSEDESVSNFDRMPRIWTLEADIRLIYRKNPNLESRFQDLGKTVNDHNTRMLVDSGCAMTSMSLAFYSKIRFGIIGPTHDETDIEMKTCAGHVTKCIGTTQVRIWLSDDNFYDSTVLIVENLSYDFILGLDFLGNRHIVRMLTPRHLIVKRTNRGRYLKYPLHVETRPSMVASNNAATIIEPFSSALLNFKIIGCDVDDKNMTFTTEKKSKIPNLHILPTAFEGNIKNGNFLLPVYNNSYRELIIDENCNIVDITQIKNNTLCNSIIDVNNFSIIEKSGLEPIPINNLTLDGKNCIEKSSVLTSEEKTANFEKLEKEGYFKPALTDYIHEKSAITELGLEDTTPMSKDEFLQQFDLKHLSAKRQEQAKKIFLENIKAFSMSKYDIGKTELIEMDIPVTNSNPKMQKYLPLPLHSREKVREILDQLEKFDIIRKCNEPSPYCSNILVIKKREKNEIRLLFDGRLLNYDTKTITYEYCFEARNFSPFSWKKAFNKS